MKRKRKVFLLFVFGLVISLALVSPLLAEAGAICGNVTDTDKDPIWGIWVYALDYDTGDFIGETSTDSDGSYSITNLPAGTYRIMADACDTAYISEYCNDKLRWEDADGVSVTSETVIDFELATATSCEADFNGDRTVNGFDLGLFAADFGRTECWSSFSCPGDFDGLGDVDGADLAVFAAEFGNTDCTTD